jgi:hypothetical protein
MRGSTILGLAIGIALLGQALPVEAGLLGSTVDVTVRFPDQSTVFLDAGNAVVGAGIEYPVGSFAAYNANLSIDLTDTQIIVSLNGTSTGFSGFFGGVPVTFNGFAITDLSGTIASAVADGSSGFSPESITIDGDTLFLNYKGVETLEALDTSIIDIETAAATTPPANVPEPVSVGLFGAGLVGLGLMRRRRTA